MDEAILESEELFLKVVCSQYSWFSIIYVEALTPNMMVTEYGTTEVKIRSWEWESSPQDETAGKGKKMEEKGEGKKDKERRNRNR